MSSEREWMKVLERYATDIAGQQLDRVEMELRKNPKKHPEYASAIDRLSAAEAQFDWEADERLTELSEAWQAHAAALAIEMYMRGVRDGGRIHHAFTTGAIT